MPDLVRARTGVTVPPPGDRDAAPADSLRGLLEGDLTVDRAVRVALLNNRGLRAEFEEIGISQAEFRQALLPKNPFVEGEVRFGGGKRNPGEVIVMQDVSSILLTPLRRQATGSALQRANLRAANAALELLRETRAAFYSLQSSEQVHRLWETAASAAQAGADLARRQYEAGNVTDLDVENEQTLYEQARIELARSQTEVAVARERLNRAMGTWGEHTAWHIASEMLEVPADTLPVAALESAAVARSLELAAADAEVRALSRAVPLARFSQFPELRAGAHFEREPDGTRTTGPAVELSVPLFDRGQHAVARARAQLRQAQDRRESLAVGIRSEVRAAHERLVGAQRLEAYYRDTVLPRRRRILELTQLEFNSMLVGVYPLLQAKHGEVSAQREAIEARRDYWIARSDLERVLAGPLETAGLND
jgi:outer membrane protein, heavy metal efflux system